MNRTAFTLEEILNWADAYDTLKYPTSLYDELVVNADTHPEKMKLMGAWKTGTIRFHKEGTAYTDKNNNTIAYTKRWSDHTPVGKDTWEYISDNFEDIRSQVPGTFQDQEPAILKELYSRKGFGYIWSLFALHCFSPETYPLYDQHVYRAYRYLESGGAECPPDQATLNWKAYSEYRQFFKDLQQKLDIPFQILDRAIWTYGKHIKPKKKRNGNANQRSKPVKKGIDITGYWAHSLTLGGKAKKFWWGISDQDDLHILKPLKSDNNLKEYIILQNELERIMKYVSHTGAVKLANSVSKLADGTEEEGLGKFMYEQIKKDPGYAQLSSQLAAIFSGAEIWEHNGRKRNIELTHREGIDYKADLLQFYIDSLDDDE